MQRFRKEIHSKYTKHTKSPTALGLSADYYQSYKDEHGDQWALNVREKPALVVVAGGWIRTTCIPQKLPGTVPLVQALYSNADPERSVMTEYCVSRKISTNYATTQQRVLVMIFQSKVHIWLKYPTPLKVPKG